MFNEDNFDLGLFEGSLLKTVYVQPMGFIFQSGNCQNVPYTLKQIANVPIFNLIQLGNFSTMYI